MAGAGLTGFLQNLSGGEMIVIVIVALVVLGPERLPDMARSAGRMAHKLKTMTEGLQTEVRDVMDDPSMQPLKELGELAARPRQKLAEYALEAEAEARAKSDAAAHAAHEAAVAAADAEEAAAEAQQAAERLGPLVAAVEREAARARGEHDEYPDPDAPATHDAVRENSGTTGGENSGSTGGEDTADEGTAREDAVGPAPRAFPVTEVTDPVDGQGPT